MSYYSILDVTPTTDAWIPNYLPTANRLVAKHGGKYVARTATHEQVEGDPLMCGHLQKHLIIEWPAKENAVAFMGDPEYAPHLKARTKGSISHHYLVEAKDDLA